MNDVAKDVHEKAMDKVEENIARLKDKQIQDEADELAKTVDGVVHELTDVERLRVENCSLRRELLQRQLNDNRAEFEAIKRDISERVEIPDGFTVALDLTGTRAKVVRKEVT